jgi:hypothetical protein
LRSGANDRLNPIELVLRVAGRRVIDDRQTPFSALKIDRKLVRSNFV